MTQTIFTPLYFANYFVDQIQDAKNKFLETVIVDPKARAPLKQFVESQREFTKQVNRSVNEFTEYSTVAAKEAVEKLAKYAK